MLSRKVHYIAVILAVLTFASPAWSAPQMPRGIAYHIGCYFHSGDDLGSSSVEMSLQASGQSTFMNAADLAGATQTSGVMMDSFTNGHLMRYVLFALIAVLGVLSYRKYLMGKTDPETDTDSEA